MIKKVNEHVSQNVKGLVLGTMYILAENVVVTS